jgi:hypothetical protein
MEQLHDDTFDKLSGSKMEDELEEVKRDIRKAKDDLERAQERGNEALELKVYC